MSLTIPLQKGKETKLQNVGDLPVVMESVAEPWLVSVHPWGSPSLSHRTSQTLVCWFCPLNVCNLLITVFVLISLSLQHIVANQMPFFEDTHMQMIAESWKSSLQLCSTDCSWRVRKGSALTLKCKDIQEVVSQNCFFLLVSSHFW